MQIERLLLENHILHMQSIHNDIDTDGIDSWKSDGFASILTWNLANHISSQHGNLLHFISGGISLEAHKNFKTNNYVSHESEI